MSNIEQTFDDVKKRLAEIVAGLISKQSPPLEARQDKTLPTGPAIAAESNEGRAGLGQHAAVFLARLEGNQLQCYAIDMFHALEDPTMQPPISKGRDPGEGDLDLAARLGSKVFGKTRESGEPSGIRIQIRPTTAWADPARSRTWTITAQQADAAYQAAQDHQTKAGAGKYYFSALGMGPGGYNCSKMAAEIVQAAGVDATSGFLIDTPGELALDSKLPNDALLKRNGDGTLNEKANSFTNILHGL